MTRLFRLRLLNFRNFIKAEFAFDGTLTILHGPNGAGKTNILEAISLLMPGRGLRGAALTDLPNARTQTPRSDWSVTGWLANDAEAFSISTGVTPESPRQRRFLLDGDMVKSQSVMLELVACLWLTPQMEGLFLEPPSGRRRFFDRLVAAREPGFARLLAAAEHIQAQRLMLLRSGEGAARWLGALEKQLAEKSVAIAAMRRDYLAALNAALAQLPPPFPKARVGLVCEIASRLDDAPALVVEAEWRERFARTRRQDKENRTTTAGANRADILICDAVTGRNASMSSTGERKALLVSVILSQAEIMKRQQKRAPILLLDEPMTHLDDMRRVALVRTLAAYEGQAFLTTTDTDQVPDPTGESVRLAIPPLGAAI